MALATIAVGALLGATAGGALGYVGAGLTGAAIGLGIGGIAGAGFGAAAYGLSNPWYWYPGSYPFYGYGLMPVYVPRRVFFTFA